VGEIGHEVAITPPTERIIVPSAFEAPWTFSKLNVGIFVTAESLDGRGRVAGDVVLELVERLPDGQLRDDLGDGAASGLRGDRRGPRDARVPFDDHHSAGLRVDAELHVRATGVDADLARDGDRRRLHALVLLVREGAPARG
jgi:hypothetical protein